MDRRRIRPKTGLLGLGLVSNGNNSNNSNISQLSSKSNSFGGFQPTFTSSKRKKSLTPGNSDDEEFPSLSGNLTSKRKRNDMNENPTKEKQEGGEASRAPSRMSNFGSQSSTKSRSSVLSQLMNRTSKSSQKPSTSSANQTTENLPNPAFQKSQEALVQSQKTPVKESQSKRRSSQITPEERLLQLTTPSKNSESESDKSLFGSDSPSTKKRARFSLGTPNDKEDNPNVSLSRSNVSRRILENQNNSPTRNSVLSLNREANKSKGGNLFSPIRPERDRDEFQSPRPVRTRNTFISFLNAAGVTLMEGESPHQINADPSQIKENMKNLLNSKDSAYKQEEVVTEWKNFIDDEDQLKKATTNLYVMNDGIPFPSWYNTSLISLLLRVAEIQPPLIESLLQKVNEIVLEAFEAKSVSWTCVILQQFRFLETIVNPEAMLTSIENLIESTPVWFQRELIALLPNIVIDCQHQTTVEILVKLMEFKPELIKVILDTIYCLTNGKQYFEELRINVTNMLETMDPSDVPAIARFALMNCDEEKPAERVLQMLRKVHLEPLPNMKVEDCFTNQMMTVQVVKSSMEVYKKIAQAAMSVIKIPAEEAKPFDLILLLLLFSTGSAARKNVEVILKQHFRSGYYRLSLFRTFYKDYLEVARDLQSISLVLASNFLRSDDRLYADIGIEWFILMILCQDKIHKQREVLEKILQQVGYNNLTAKNSFTILSKMIADNEKRTYLQSHCNVLRILLEKLDNLDLENVAILNDVLHGLCTQSSSVAESLQEDLFILMQKYLASPKPLTKCKGVLSAVMAIKHLASKEETCPKARDIFEKIRAQVKLCPRSRALFYDWMSQVVADAENLNKEFLEQMKTYFENVLEEYLADKTQGRDDMEVKFGLNTSHDEASNLAINFGEGKFGAIVPALFRVLRMCSMRLSENDSLEDINALLGCAIILPKDLESPESRNLDYLLYCINWFRELISGFVKQSDSLMQRQVLKRLDNLIQMQGDFQMMVSMCDTRYQPPQAYFHYFPAKPFVKVDKKSSKKGRKAGEKKHSVSIPEWESFDLGSLLASKNPTYFRRLDTKVVYLLDVKMDMTLTQNSSQAISIAQVCFLIKELLGMLENDDSESLINDLMSLLPQICGKLQDILQELRENEIDNSQKREVVVLLLRLINQIFNWKELFQSVKYNLLLRDGLRTLASQIRVSNASQVTTKDLVSESYKFFALMSDIAAGRSVILAYAIVSVCETLMKHSKSFSADNKEKHATMAYDFLKSQDWLDKQSGAAYRSAIAGLLKAWIENEPCPLSRIKELMQWLPTDVESLQKPRDCLKNLPSINKNNFPLFFKKIFEGLIKGAKNDLRDTNSDTIKLGIMKDVGLILKEILKICRLLKMKTVYSLSVRYLIILVRMFLTQGLPILEYNLKYQVIDGMDILKLFQGATRYLHNIYCTGIDKQDTSLAKYGPASKSIREEFICRAKAMMALNNSLDAFETGNLIRKDLEGRRILSQSSVEESISVVGDEPTTSDGGESRVSEILGQDEELLEESAAEESVDEDDNNDDEDTEDINIDSI